MTKTQTKEERIAKIIAEERVWMCKENDKYEFWVVRGEHDVYDVVYFKLQDRYTCSCKNIRTIVCYHILSVIKVKNETKPSISPTE